MTVVEKLKEARLVARKNSDNALSSFYAFVISEIEKIGKDDGNRVTTEDEAIRVIEKTKGKIEEAVSMGGDIIRTELLNQIAILKKYIPEKASEEEVKKFVEELSANNPGINKGIFMKELKNKFGSNIDMRVAGFIVDEVIENG